MQGSEYINKIVYTRSLTQKVGCTKTKFTSPNKNISDLHCIKGSDKRVGVGGCSLPAISPFHQQCFKKPSYMGFIKHDCLAKG